MKDPLPTAANPVFKLLDGKHVPVRPEADTLLLRMRALEASHALAELEKVVRIEDILKAPELERLAAARALSTNLSKGYIS